MPTRLLCCIAHPDDECFAFGGALALAARAGVVTDVVCVTDGQAATNRGVSESGQDLGRIRRDEFARSCAVLGVVHTEIYGYQDGALQTAPFDEIARRLVERIRRTRPEIVLTFGLDGALNVHVDHAMVSCMASCAFHWAGRAKRYPELGLEPFAPSRLYHLTTNYTLPDREPLLPAPWDVKLDIRAVAAQKEAAFREHTSQLPVFDKVKPYWDKYGDSEYYVLAAAKTPREAVIAASMFDDLD